MNKKIVITVIIPVYNVESEISGCLDSLLEQSFPLDLVEVILIDDGSRDNSYRLIKQYEPNFPVVRILKQENQGLAEVRNQGISLASGEYIAFLDSDDMYCPDFLQVMTQRLEEDQSDFAICDVLVDKGDKDFHPYLDTLVWKKLKHVKNTSIKESPSLLLFQPSVWRRVFKKDFLLSFKFPFAKGLKFEDFPFHFKAMIQAEKISLIDQPLYIYNDHRPTSITKTVDSSLFDLLIIFEEVHHIFETSRFKKLLPLVYQVERRTLRWGYKKITKTLKSDFFQQYKKSLSFYNFMSRIKGFCQFIKQKVIKRI